MDSIEDTNVDEVETLKNDKDNEDQPGLQKLDSQDTKPTIAPRDNKRHRIEDGNLNNKKVKVNKYGDNTITTEGNCPCLLQDVPDLESQEVDWFRSTIDRLRSRAELVQFEHAQHGYRIRSLMHPGSIAGGTGDPIFMDGIVAPTADAAARFEQVHVETEDPKFMTKLESDSFKDFMTGGVIDERKVGSTMQAYLNANHQNTSRGLAATFQLCDDRFDMAAFYAKGFFYAILREIFANNVIAPEFGAFGDAEVQWINTRPQPPADVSQDINTAVLQRRIILVENHDFMRSAESIQALYWLAQPGARMQCPADARKISASYYRFRRMPITIITSHAAPAAAPQPANVAPDVMFTLMNRMATYRNEKDDMMRGLYMAIELAFSNYTVARAVQPVAANAAANPPIVAVAGYNLNRPVDCWLEMSRKFWPRPMDYNFAHRAVRIHPVRSETFKSESDAFFTSQMTIKIKSAALYWQTISSTVSSLFNGLNIKGSDLQNWLAGHSRSALFNEMIGTHFLSCQNLEGFDEAQVYKTVRASIKMTMDVSICPGTRQTTTWNRGPGIDPTFNIDSAYNIEFPNTTPALTNNLMCIDEWLKLRPIEWGLSNISPKVNFEKDVRLIGPAVTLGWDAKKGDASYSKAVTGPQPYAKIPYGHMAINAVLNQIRADEVAVDTSEAECPQYENDVIWSNPIVAEENFPMIEALHILEPMSVFTYSWQDDVVIAPRIAVPCGGGGLCYAMYNWRDIHLRQAGFLKVGLTLPESRPGRTMLPPGKNKGKMNPTSLNNDSEN